MPKNLQALRTCAETDYCLGQLVLAAGNPNPAKVNLAIFYFEKALEYDNSIIEARIKIAEFYFQQEEYEKAAKWYKEIRAYKKLEECHKRMIAKAEDDPRFLVKYGNCLREMGIYELAKKQYMDAIGLYNLMFNIEESKKLYQVVNEITIE